MMITANGIMIRIDVDDISKIGRSTQGVKLLGLNEGDALMALAVRDKDAEEIVEE